VIDKDKKIFFFGTPAISVEILKGIYESGYQIVGVATREDKAVGRKKIIAYSEVKKYCIDRKLFYIQPNKLKSAVEIIQRLQPDLIVTCAYGLIIPKSILSIPKYGCVNIHTSLLPKYRGGAPIH
jgi:methionyl-tRNA formyltransferase